MKGEKNVKKLPRNVANIVKKCELASRKTSFLHLSKYNDN